MGKEFQVKQETSCVINCYGDAINSKVKSKVDRPVVVHFQSVDFHGFDQLLFFFNNDGVNHNWQQETQSEWVNQESDNVDQTVDFEVEIGLERHKLNSTLNECVWELFTDVSLVGNVSNVDLPLNGEAHVFSHGLLAVWVVHTDLSDSVVSMILQISVVVHLEFVIKKFVIGLVNPESSIG